MMLIEVIADTLNDAILAEKAGADRIELITAVGEGGLTPSYGLIEAVCQAVSIPVSVMVRPHSRSFTYTEQDVAIMKSDIKACKDIGAAGVVIGAITSDGKVDEEALSVLLESAEDLDVTYHRAFDHVKNQMEALEVLKSYKQITRILTSGGAEKAPQAKEQLQELIKSCEGTHLTIMPGSGITPENIAAFLQDVTPREIHVGSGVRKNRSLLHEIDVELLQTFKKLCNTAGI
ncbi:copper homeostasis protein CutC [Cytobacillus gottheilii]|uniref:copper homeostasis protein CutC n=1 Tax=Cytobacillus gottheilii TaxID=859144 RepID=UPI0027D473E5|nr:copper homeostasis protein CutC [Cytobacillus gottheilii]